MNVSISKIKTISLLLMTISCQKSKLPTEGMVDSLLYTLRKESKLDIRGTYQITKFVHQLEHDKSIVNSNLLFDKNDIADISNQFRTLRRNATSTGYGKNPSGWEYYKSINSTEQFKYIIDTINNQIIINHQIYYDLQ